MKKLKHPWIVASVGALSVMCITFVVLLATGTIQVGSGASDSADPPAPVDTAHAAAYAAIDTEEMRAGLEAIGLSDVPENVLATLSTLEKIDEFPIYTMRYFGPYVRASELRSEDDGQAVNSEVPIDWACSLFAAVGDPSWPVFGRNFDWEYSPILVLLLEPEEGYRSIMSIDIAYLVEPGDVDRLDECEVERLLSLLSAPFLTFDGMNEKGLAIGMASVDYECGYPSDPNKRDVGDLRLMREVLESSATVDEAIAFLEGINPVSQGGPNTHYLIADDTPSAALIEYQEGEMYVFRSSAEAPWQLGTNFPVVLTDGNPTGRCWRYDLIEQTLRENGGDLSSLDSMELLEGVSTSMTQWSITYDLSKRIMYLAVGGSIDTVYGISLETGEAVPQPGSGSRH